MYELSCLAAVLLEYFKGFLFDFLDFGKFVQFGVCMLTAGISAHMFGSKSIFDKEGRFLTGMIMLCIFLSVIITNLNRGFHGEQYWIFWTLICLHWSVSIAWICYMCADYK